MKRTIRGRAGFTIVELLIVVVVVAVLAAVTIVAYRGVQNQSRQSVVQSSAQQAAKKVMQYQIENNVLPSDPAVAGLVNADGLTYSLTSSGDWFCIIASKDGESSGVGSGGHCGGLSASYYNNRTMTGTPALKRIDKNLYLEWANGSPGAGVNDNDISAVWTGYITAPTTATYTLYVYPDDSVKFYLNGSLVIDAPTCCGDYVANYSFNAGQKIPLRVEFVEITGAAYIRTTWSYPGQARTTIPSSAFSAY